MNIKNIIKYVITPQMLIILTLINIVELKASNINFSKNYLSYIASQQVKFDRINTNQGLSQSSVTCILQDHQGFMWFGTYKGLCRYDGNKFEIFQNNLNDSTSLGNDMVWSICEDKDNILWVGTWDGGLNRFNAKSNSFTRYYNKPNDSCSLSNNIIRFIFADSDNNLWIGTENGLNKLNRKNGKFTHYNFIYNNHFSCGDNRILCMLEDTKNNYWIGTDAALLHFNPLNGTIKKFTDSFIDPKTSKKYGVNCMYKDYKGNLWIGTWGGGAFYMNVNEQSFIHFGNDKQQINSLSNNVVMSILEDKNHDIWFGTRGGGIDILNIDNKIFNHIVTNEYDQKSLSNNTIYCLFKDSDNIIWIGTDYGGINKYDPNKDIFRAYVHNPIDKNTLHNKLVTAIYEDSKGILWLGGKEGLDKYDRKNNKVELITFFTPGKDRYINTIRAIREDHQGNLWLGTDGDGVICYNPITKKYRSYTYNPSIPKSISQDFIHTIIVDHNGEIWLASQNTGINKYDPVHDGFTKIRANNTDPNSLSDDKVVSIYEDSNNDIWIGTIAGGINKYVRSENRFVRFINSPHDSMSISGDYINVIYEDRKKRMWFGTMNNGLNLYNPDKKNFIRFTESDGLSSNRIFGILSDDNNFIWVSTEKGLNKIDPVSRKIITYRISDGLYTDEFQIRSFCHSKTGELLFGGQNCVVVFDPLKIKKRSKIPRMVYTDFKIFYKSVKFGQLEDGRTILSAPVSITKNITLSYKDAVITFEFAVLHYAAPEENKYAYKLEGFENKWNYVGNNHSATYTNLDPSKYIFRVKGSNCDNVWNNEGISINITIKPPFWATWWFKLIVILIILSGFIGYYFYRVNAIQKKNKELEKAVKERTKVIVQKNALLIEQANELNNFNTLLEERQEKVEEQSRELFIQNEKIQIAYNKVKELVEMKDKVFSIIGHDLKNPINVIMGFSSLLESKKDTLSNDKRDLYIQNISIAANNTFTLLENLLEWARSQTGQYKFQPKNITLIKLIQSNLTLLKEQYQKKNISIKLNVDKSYVIKADQNMIETILRNLISNAIKYTYPGGEITISSEDSDKSDFITVSVLDTGVGIAEDKLNKLFHLDTSSSTNGTSGEEGTGLGLLLCYEFIEKNGGKIWVKSEIEKGSEFSFTVPKPNKLKPS